MTQIDVQKIADEAPLGAFHWQVLLWCAAIVLIDGYDLAVVGVALPTIITSMKVDPTVAGVMGSSALFGMAFGAMFLGTLADRWGRKVTVSLCVFLFSAFTAAAGFMHEPIGFCVLWFLAGCHDTSKCEKSPPGNSIGCVGCEFENIHLN
jgi:AAHS family benzoate transporter-like MFS transporter